jgi:hypothetical protein
MSELPELPELTLEEGALEGAGTGLLGPVEDSEVEKSLSCICFSGTSSTCLAILAG